MTAKEATDLAFRELRVAENVLKLAKPEQQHSWRRHSGIGQRLGGCDNNGVTMGVHKDGVPKDTTLLYSRAPVWLL